MVMVVVVAAAVVVAVARKRTETMTNKTTMTMSIQVPKDHANSTAQRNIVGTNLRQHEEEGKDKRNDFNRTLDLCTELNNIIDQEIQRRDLLMTQIKALESERVVLLKNTDRYTQEEIDLHKHIQNCNK